MRLKIPGEVDADFVVIDPKKAQLNKLNKDRIIYHEK